MSEQEKIQRAKLGDYLRLVAQMIEQGSCQGFDIVWSVQSGAVKPDGIVVASCDFFHVVAPQVESENPRELPSRATNKLSQGKIAVSDIMEEIKKLNECADPECPQCKGKYS